jgi:hypothetical protein
MHSQGASGLQLLLVALLVVVFELEALALVIRVGIEARQEFGIVIQILVITLEELEALVVLIVVVEVEAVARSTAVLLYGTSLRGACSRATLVTPVLRFALTALAAVFLLAAETSTPLTGTS